MLHAVKVRLYPNRTQATQINKLLGCCRVVYNQCLARKIDSYNTNGTIEDLITLGKFIRDELLHDDRFEWLRGNNTKVLRESMRDMLKAYDNFFKLHKGFPKFKSKKKHRQSCRFELGAISKVNDYTSSKLSLANIRHIKFKCSDKYATYLQANKENIRHATLTRTPCNEYYLSILVDGDITRTVKTTNNAIGIDLGIKNLITTSNGDTFENKHFMRNQDAKLRRINKQLSKKNPGSHNYNKARIKLAKVYKHITTKTNNYLHEVTNKLIDENQVICMEDLNVSGLMKNHHIAGAIQEVNLGELRRMLEYKANWYGRQLVFIDKFYPSSKTCHNCGNIYRSLKLSEREWVCEKCHEVINRDYNAALNILDNGIRLLP